MNNIHAIAGTLPKLPQANAETNALSKSMQADPMKKRNF